MNFDKNRSENYERFIASEQEAWKKESKILLKCYHTSLPRTDVAEKTFEKFVTSPENENLVCKLQKWNPEMKIGIVLHGQPGTGKTHLLKAVCIKWGSDYCRTMFRTAALMLAALRENLQHLDSVLSLYIQPDMLCIDDFGAEKKTDWTQEQLLSIIDKRLALGKITHMTTNLAPKDFPAIYGYRISDRLKEAMIFEELLGDTHRNKIYLENKEKWRNL